MLVCASIKSASYPQPETAGTCRDAWFILLLHCQHTMSLYRMHACITTTTGVLACSPATGCCPCTVPATAAPS